MKHLAILVFFLFFVLINSAEDEEGFNSNIQNTYAGQDDPKTKAFIVLTNKCNICHARKKRIDIFTLENMDSLAADIQEQVFVKKKMPKGKSIILTEGESRSLRRWLTIVHEDGKNTENKKSR